MKLTKRSSALISLFVLSLALETSSIGLAHAQSAAPAYPKPLILLAEARTIVDGAIAYARGKKFDIAIAVVDSWGNIVSSDRMDGASLRHIGLAQGKAYASALYRQTTEQMSQLAKTQPDRYFGILSMYPGKMYLVGGGVPLASDGVLVGGVGVAGGPEGEDEKSSRAGMAAWTTYRESLKK